MSNRDARRRERQQVYARIETHRKVMLGLSALSFLIGGGLIAGNLASQAAMEWIDYLLFLGLPLVATFALTRVHRNKTTSLVMPHALARLKKRLGPDPIYVRRANFHTEILDNSGLVDTADGVHTTHLITSRLPSGESLSLCNVQTYRETERKGKKTREVVDEGVFVDRKTRLRTGISFVIRDRKMFSSKTLRCGPHDRETLQRVDKLHPAFDKHYLLYTSDRIKTLRFLSPTVIETFMTLARQKGHVSELSLFDDQLYVFVNQAEISIPYVPLTRATPIKTLILDALGNLKEILDIIDLIQSEQRMQRLNHRETPDAAPEEEEAAQEEEGTSP